MTYRFCQGVVSIKAAYITCLLALLSFLLTGSSSFAASHFVRPVGTGSGNGTDWNNAWAIQSIGWDKVAPGDKIFLAGGAYTEALTIGKSGTAASPIKVLRVRSSDLEATQAAGWNAAFDAQVRITNSARSISRFVGIKWDKGANIGDYVTIDGRIQDGISIGVADQTSPSDYWMSSICVWLNTAVTGVTLTNLEMVGPGSPYLAASTGLYVNGSNTKSKVLVSHCRFHDMVQAVQVGTSLTDSTFEYCSFFNMVPGNNGWPSSSFNPQHDNTIWASGTANIVFRFNKIYNWATESLLLTGSGNGKWEIYGNVWYDSRSTGRVIETQANTGPVYFYNNTCVNVPGFGIRYLYGTSQILVTNNIFFNVGSVDPLTKDYNLYSGATSEKSGGGGITTSIFANYSGKDFRLSSTAGNAIDKGAPLQSAYAIDANGTPRPQGSGWDIGAFEWFSGTVSNPTNSTPTNSIPQTNTPALVVASSPVAWLKLDKLSGSVLPDSTTNGNSGTLIGYGSIGEGYTGASLVLEGSGYARIPSSNSLKTTTNGVTVGCWIYVDPNSVSAPGEVRSFVRHVLNETGTFPYSAYDLVLIGEAGGFYPRFGATSDTGNRASTMGPKCEFNTWYHLAGAFDGATLRLFVNGVEVGRASLAGRLASAAQDVCVGAYGEESPIIGRIDDLRIYRTVLPDDRIKGLSVPPVRPGAIRVAKK